MALIDENTVEAVNQVKESSVVSYLGNANAKYRILILGNSITRHSPKSDIGWELDCGMAASCEENDYVHTLYRLLKNAGYDVYVRVRQASEWEVNITEPNVVERFSKDKDFGADYIVFRLGENIKAQNRPNTYSYLKEFASYLTENKGEMIYLTSFWESEELDKGIQKVAEERNEIWKHGGFSADPTTMALGKFEHDGVAKHPGDKGMRLIAEGFFDILKTKLTK